MPAERPAKGPTLAELSARVAELVEECEALEAKLPVWAAEEEAARLDSYRTDPSKRSDVGGARSEVAQLARKQREAETRIVALRKEINAAAVVMEELRATESLAAFDAAIAGIKDIDAVEAEALEDLTRAQSAWMEAWQTLQDVYAAKRAYPGNFTLDSQGRVNELRTAAERTLPIGPPNFFENRPVWEFMAEEVFKKLNQTAAIEAVAPPNMWYHLPENPSDFERVENFNAINRARIEGVSTQPLPVLPEHLGGPKRESATSEPEPVAVEPDEDKDVAGPREGTHNWLSRRPRVKA